jgi:hypothetical protein
MNTSYPHQRFHPQGTLTDAIRPICAYCLHLLVHAQGGTPLSYAMRRELEEHHQCPEKLTARKPDVALPYN